MSLLASKMPLLENCGNRLSIQAVTAPVTWKIEPNIFQGDFVVTDMDKFALGLFVCQLLLKVELFAAAKLLSECIPENASLSPVSGIWLRSFCRSKSSKIGCYALTRITNEWLEKLKKLR